MTDEEFERFYSRYGAAQGIDRMRRDFRRLRRYMEATGTAGQPVALDTVAGMQAALHALEKLPEPTPDQKAKAHEIRDMLAAMGVMGDRPYKG